MTNTENIRMHWTTRIGVGGVMLFMAVVVILNGFGWINTLPGFAGLAACVLAIGLELMAFVAWEHIVAYSKAKAFGRLALCAGGLLLAIAMNVEGGHRGLNVIAAPLHSQAEAERRASQDALDASRRGLEHEIAAVQARIDAVAATNPGETYQGRMAEWRQNFAVLTADDRAQLAALRGRLDAAPLSVARRDPYPSWGPYAVAAVFVFFSVFGLTMFGVKIPGAELTFKSPAKRPAKKPQSHKGENIIDLGTARDSKRDTETVLRLHKAGYSVRQIEAETGISKSRAQRLIGKAE